MKKLTFIAAALAFSFPVFADVAIDLSASKLVVKDPTTIRIENLNAPGAGNFQLDFKWNPVTLNFVPDAASLIPNGSYCQSATLSGNAAYSGVNVAAYGFRSRSSANLEVGAIGPISFSTNVFMVGWAKTQLAADNPYLAGQTITNFDPTKGYGVVGASHTPAYPGLKTGDVVVVTGSASVGAIAIRKLDGSASTTFTVAPPTTAKLTTNCPRTASGTYSGNISYGGANINYTVAIFDSLSGSINALRSGVSAFTVTWDSLFTGKPGFMNGMVGEALNVAYPQFTAGGKTFIADVGDGLAFGALDANGMAVGSTAFFTGTSGNTPAAATPAN